MSSPARKTEEPRESSARNGGTSRQNRVPGAPDWGHLMEAGSTEASRAGVTAGLELLRRQEKKGKNTPASPLPNIAGGEGAAKQERVSRAHHGASRE